MSTQRLSIRTRLTLAYAATFAAVSTILVVVTYFLVSHSMRSQFHRLNQADFLGKANADLPPYKILFLESDGTPVTAGDLKGYVTEQQQAALDATASSLLSISIAVALAGGLLVLAVCWVMSGRVLRPLATISDTAESIAGSSLDRRIRLDGPPDELKRLADSFDAMLERLAGSFDGQRRFVGNASHELRTPLAVSRTLIQVAMDRPGASADLKELGMKLLGINRDQTRLTEALLTLAHSDQELADPAVVDAGAITLGVITRRRPSAVAARITLNSDVRPAVVLGDPVLLGQLVDNLVGNAIAYNHPGGRVEVSLSAKSDGLCWLVVENTGAPIAPEAVNDLFEPFRRLGTDRVISDRSPNGPLPGVGLGLSIVRSITRAHRGQIHATARPDGGLLVEVTFPLRAAAPIEQEQPGSHHSRS